MIKKSSIVLFCVFIIMFLLNYMTPLYNEDYFAIFVWPMGVPNLGELPENARRVSSVSDVFESLKVYYLTGGGRVSAALIGAPFVCVGKVLFNPFNSLMFLLLGIEIYWLTHEGEISGNFNSSNLFWIFFALWTFNAPFIGTYLWMSGATNYLWMMVVILAFLIPYVKNFYNSQIYMTSDNKFVLGMFFLGIVAGCSLETIVCWLIMILFYWLYLCKKDNKLQLWKCSGFAGLCIGYGILILAPGNFTRLAETQYYISSSSRFVEFICIMFFHFILWYFVLKFVFICRKKIYSGKALKHFRMAKASLVVAAGSAVINSLLPVSGWRPSFLTLIFLIITCCLLFYAQREANLSPITDSAKTLLKYIAVVYMLFSVAVSLYGSFGRWEHWNEMIEHIKAEQKLNPDSIVEVTLPVENQYENSFLWRFLAMSRIIYQPVISDDETDRINKIVAKYYGIKGIRAVKNKLN